VDVLLNSPFAHASLGAGLAVLCGLRAFLPLAVFGLFAHFQWLAAPVLAGTGFAFLANAWLVWLFFVLGVAEVVVDKVPVLNRAQDFVGIPIRVAAGAILFGAALVRQGTPALVIGLVAGAAIAGAAHGAKSVMRPGAVATVGSAHPYLSLLEDLAASLGTVVVLLLPSVGILLVAFLLFLIYRILRRGRRKYKGLRILKD
jgi:uncharacterized membrane protein